MPSNDGRRAPSRGDLTGIRATQLRSDRDKREAAEKRLAERAEAELEAEMRRNASPEGTVIDLTDADSFDGFSTGNASVGADNQVGGGR